MAHIISKLQIKGEIYEIHAKEAESAEVAESAKVSENSKVTERTKGALIFGNLRYDGSEDVSLPIYEGEITEEKKV